MEKQKELILLAQRVRALAQNGLTYSQSEYDTERYEELIQISNQMASVATGFDASEIDACYRLSKEYATPKVDVRARFVCWLSWI